MLVFSVIYSPPYMWSLPECFRSPFRCDRSAVRRASSMPIVKSRGSSGLVGPDRSSDEGGANLWSPSEEGPVDSSGDSNADEWVSSAFRSPLQERPRVLVFRYIYVHGDLWVSSLFSAAGDERSEVRTESTFCRFICARVAQGTSAVAPGRHRLHRRAISISRSLRRDREHAETTVASYARGRNYKMFKRFPHPHISMEDNQRMMST